MAIARKGARKRTRHPGVYAREITNRQGKADTAIDIMYRHNGKLVWRCVGLQSQGQNAAAASRLRALILDDLAHGGDGRAPMVKAGLDKPEPGSPGTIATFADAYALWFDRVGSQLAEHGRNEDSFYRNWLQHSIGPRRLDAITKFDIDNVKAAALAAGIRPSTVHRIIGVATRVYRRLAAWDIYKGESPTRGVTLPKIDNARTRFLTREEASALLDELARMGSMWHDAAWISLHTGLRQSEIFSLRGTSVDFEGRQLIVRDAKTGSRSLPLTDEVAAFLRRRMPERPGDLLFPLQRGAKRIKRCDTPFRKAIDKLGFNDGITDSRHKVVFHTLRHTFCSWLAMAGVPLHTIARLAGHKTTKMTERYAHLAPDQGRAAASLVGEILSGSRHM